MGTLLFGPSSELAKRNASGQLIQVAEPGKLMKYNRSKYNQYTKFNTIFDRLKQSRNGFWYIYLAVGVRMAGAPSVIGE